MKPTTTHKVEEADYNCYAKEIFCFAISSDLKPFVVHK